MVTAPNSGPMVQDTRVNGNSTRPTDKANWFTLMGMSMKVTGSTIKLTERVLTLMLTELTTREPGLMTSSTDSELNPGLMVPATRVSTKKVKKRETVA